MTAVRQGLFLLGLGFLAMLVSHAWWEGNMATHMGGQIPLLVLWGGVLTVYLRRMYPSLDAWGQRYRASLFLFALFTLGLWMVPRLLDASVHAFDMALLKWLSLTLAGTVLVLSWRHLPWLLRAVLQLEAIATLLRLGWLYLEAPQRYCVSYGLDDQRSLGILLMVYAAIYGGGMGVRALLGRPADAEK